MTSTYSLPLLYCFALLSVVTSASLIMEFRSSKCNNASRYANGSTYSINLEAVMDHLASNASSTRFGNYSYGQSPNKVYGLLQCIGNIPPEDCQNCSREATSKIQAYCANDIGGQVWMNYCFLRYSNSSFFSILDTTGYLLENVNAVRAQNLLPSKNITFGLLSNLINLAPGNDGFASASTSYLLSNGVSGDVYGLAQCWRDISINNCRVCFLSAIQALESCCSNQTGAQALFGSCTIRFELYPFFFDENTPTPSPAGDSPPPTKAESPAPQTSGTNSKKSSHRLAIILGTTGSAILGIASLFIFAMRKGMPCLILNKELALSRDNKDASQKMLFTKEHIMFSLQTLIEATGGFSSNNKLGEGGFGSVYKGAIHDGQEIAVKKLSATSGQGTAEFMNEVEIVANIQHRNLVKLLGCCVEGDERLLVYEFLPNKSLDTFLFDPVKSIQLDWQKRYNIIAGIARGLLYLHQDSQVRIIHRDIKANNILLDEKLNPKIADFGLARLFADNETEIQSRVAGTYGYMAPEYAMGGQLSVKVDVYSFGVLLLEIAWRLYKQGNVLTMVDSAVAETCPEEQSLRCIQVGLLCTQADADVRPLMSTVVLMLTSNSEPLPNPKKPAFVSMGHSRSVNQNPCSNLASLSVLEAR